MHKMRLSQIGGEKIQILIGRWFGTLRCHQIIALWKRTKKRRARLEWFFGVVGAVSSSSLPPPVPLGRAIDLPMEVLLVLLVVCSLSLFSTESAQNKLIIIHVCILPAQSIKFISAFEIIKTPFWIIFEFQTGRQYPLKKKIQIQNTRTLMSEF